MNLAASGCPISAGRSRTSELKVSTGHDGAAETLGTLSSGWGQIMRAGGVTCEVHSEGQIDLIFAFQKGPIS